MWHACRRWLVHTPASRTRAGRGSLLSSHHPATDKRVDLPRDLPRNPHPHHHPHPLRGSPPHATSDREPGLQPMQHRTAGAPRKRPVTRVSVLTALEHAPAAEHDGNATSAAANVPSSLVCSPAAASPYLQDSSFARQFETHRRRMPSTSAASAASRAGPALGSRPTTVPASSLEDMKHQQAALRAAYAYADKHHRIRVKKDRRVYVEEVRAFRAVHGGRRPSAQEVSPHTDVSLAPVTALQAYAHLDPKRASMHAQLQDGLLLQQSITRSELMKSNARTLVRCLNCFHVYGARPRRLWGAEDSSASGGSGQQSWIALEREQEKVARTERVMRRPGLRKQMDSVGRRQQRAVSSPVACPQCGSPRAQWAMEYVHYRTHAK